MVKTDRAWLKHKITYVEENNNLVQNTTYSRVSKIFSTFSYNSVLFNYTVYNKLSFFLCNI